MTNKQFIKYLSTFGITTTARDPYETLLYLNNQCVGWYYNPINDDSDVLKIEVYIDCILNYKNEIEYTAPTRLSCFNEEQFKQRFSCFINSLIDKCNTFKKELLVHKIKSISASEF